MPWQAQCQNLKRSAIASLPPPKVSESFKLTTTQLDCLNWMVETMPRKDPWSPEKIVQVLLGLWFASVHQLAMVNSLCILFTRDRYIDCN